DGGGGGGGGGGGAATASVAHSAPSPAQVTAGSLGITVTATVLKADGTASSGTSVTFSVSPASVATVTASAVTDAGGRATATLLGTQRGTAGVTARALGVSSSALSVAVLGPAITLTAAPASIQASQVGTGGAVVTATVSDHQGNRMPGQTVAFSTSLGSVSAASAGPEDGQYRSTLTSTATGTADVVAKVRGATSSAVSVTVSAAALTTLTLSPAVNKIEPGDSTTLAVTAADALGNPVNATVTFATTLGSVVPASLALADGAGEVTLVSSEAAGPGTARVTATVGAVSKSTDVVIAENPAGEPANIAVTTSPADGRVTVAGVGGTERLAITVTVTDSAGAPVAQVANNVLVEISRGPGGGERLVGGSTASQLTLSTDAEGEATAVFQSGTVPGTVDLKVSVTKDKNGATLATPLVATVPTVTIQAGPPFSVVMGKSNRIVDNLDGTLTHNYFALVSDRYGNAVPDGTAVYFGQIYNILDEGTDGVCTAGTASFTSATGGFLANGVGTGDTLVLLEGDTKGGYLVSTDPAAETVLTTTTAFAASGASLSYVVGNNAGGGVITTANSTTTDGKAIWSNTYPGPFVNRRVVVYAEAEGRKIGDATDTTFDWVAPTKFSLTGPLTVTRGATYSYSVTARDGTDPGYAIAGLPVSLSATAGVLSTPGLTTGAGGTASFTWTAPGAAGSVTLTVTGGGTSTPFAITVQ
ncbi:MAG: hypothetical protein HGA98_00705, partial [Deltaproteobacteria bacterium]|nr:hypothetical protein [Deltaproteobacteria bacterium]